jgi:hypothetical protein
MQQRNRISPAIMALGLVALVLAAAGGAAASGLISGKSIKRHSIPLTALSASAVKALQGKAGVNGANGTNGANGAPGTARAWGDVFINGLNNAAWDNQSGFPDVPRKSGTTGRYCIPPPAGVDGNTIAVALSADGVPSVPVQVSPSDCGAHEIEVITYPFVSGVLNEAQFLPFNIVVP